MKEKKTSADRRIGMVLAFILFLLIIGLVAYALYLSSPWIVGVLPLCPLVGSSRPSLTLIAQTNPK